MRFRNFIPLLILLFFSLPLGLIFLYVWESQTLVLCATQLVHLSILIFAYSTGVKSAQKNFNPPLALGKVVYLPLKVNLVLYLLIGLPIVVIYARNYAALMIAYVISLASFTLAYLSGVTYVVRSAPTRSNTLSS